MQSTIREQVPDDSTATVRVLSRHALAELVRIRSELEATSRLLMHAHIVAGSCPEKYRQGDTFPAIALAAHSTDEAIGLVSRFLELQVGVTRDPLTVLAELDDERGTDRDFDLDGLAS